MPSSAVFHTPLATVSWSWGTSGVLRGSVAGEIDATNRVEVIGEVRERLRGSGARAVHIDAARLTFCDARSLVEAAAVVCAARDKGAHLEVANLAPHLTRLLGLLVSDPCTSALR